MGYDYPEYSLDSHRWNIDTSFYDLEKNITLCYNFYITSLTVTKCVMDNKKSPECQKKAKLGLWVLKFGGENGIRTHGGHTPSAVFETILSSYFHINQGRINIKSSV